MAWIGVDFDGTLVEYHGWQGPSHMGPAVPAMLERVQLWLDRGMEVRIVTARVNKRQNPHEASISQAAIEAWCQKHLGQALRVTCEKDSEMIELWDDRVVLVERNTGRVLSSRGGAQ